MPGARTEKGPFTALFDRRPDLHCRLCADLGRLVALGDGVGVANCCAEIETRSPFDDWDRDAPLLDVDRHIFIGSWHWVSLLVEEGQLVRYQADRS